MSVWFWAVTAILAVAVLVLAIKVYLLQKAADEIGAAFAERLKTDTNTLVDLSSRDTHLRNLANAINGQLRMLRSERHRFQQGDLELKNAVTNISHDLRTPLTAICGYLDLLEQEETSDTVRRYLAVIRNRAELLTQLTEELFRYSVILATQGDLVLEQVSLNRVLEESIAAFYTGLTKRGIAPSIQMPQEPVLRTLDCAALTRVFSNLLNNAIAYSDGDLEITLSETGEICFANSASGLNEVQVGKLFDRFYTVETARNATGLGLAIARALVEQMCGTISAQYENNRLRICIFFPDAQKS